ncbi:MAG: MBL fold metallo-hydrolase [Candidatus Pacearchaeota archaeon]|nr:MBL fold metallo-hydrolase [Candidatus Pacearchaeota archaeon]
MAEIKILIQGYARPGEGEQEGVELASSTTTLIKEGKLNIIVDPGMNRKILLEALKKEKLSPEKINYVVLTHYHLDHSLLTGIFENAVVIDNTTTYTFKGEIKDHEGKIPGTNIDIIKTPGHDQFHCSLLVNSNDLGKVAIVGDVFWWADEEEQKTDEKSLMNHEDPYMKNEKDLKDSRKKILAIADYIIPGHGKMFKVEK